MERKVIPDQLILVGATLPTDAPQPASPPLADTLEAPDFSALLRNPIVKEELPPDFSITAEAGHLNTLWNSVPRLRQYLFLDFVHAGGSGMVFRVAAPETRITQALKVARQHLIQAYKESAPHTQKSLSPVSERELLALKILSHPNVVHLEDALDSDVGIVAISTTYVEDPAPVNKYLAVTLDKRPKGRPSFASERIDHACSFLVERCIEVSSAMATMHSNHIYHFDIKPANILIARDHSAVLTDMGACVHARDLGEKEKLRVQFTWTYAHEDLTSIISKPRNITGGGLKATAEVDSGGPLARYDLFAFGRTIQECLATIASEFGDRCFASYGFRFLWLIASLLLDGRNAPAKDRTKVMDGKKFVSDVAMGYPVALFGEAKIKTADDLHERLLRFRTTHTWSGRVPELDPWQPELINTGPGGPAAFTARIRKLFDHPAMKRLKSELQLGWVREVYPGATHDRWSHSIGVVAASSKYISALLSDPEVPTLRILADQALIEHTLVAAAIHDLGQTAFGHDIEAAAPVLYNHERIIARLLREVSWGKPTLWEVIENEWKGLNLSRVLAILNSTEAEAAPYKCALDWVATDIVDGPIDADKYDYVIRDSVACGVAYGAGVDRERFLQALTADVTERNREARVHLAYRAKSNAAIQSLLIGRFQLYNAIYWHHTFRCIQAMLSHAYAETFGLLEENRRSVKLREWSGSASTLKELFYQWVVCGKPPQSLKIGGAALQDLIARTAIPVLVNKESVFAFVWLFASDPMRNLVVRLARRHLYKRAFELRVSEVGPAGDYSAIAAEFTPLKRLASSAALREALLARIYRKITESGPAETVGENEARRKYQELKEWTVPLVIVDFPCRGVPDEKNVPRELGDPARKYLPDSARLARSESSVFHAVRHLQSQMATMRVFVEPEFHVLVARYLDPDDIKACVDSSIPILA